MNEAKSYGPWTNVVGAARTLLALGTLTTLLFNPATHLFMPLGRSLHGIVDRLFPGKYGLFFLFGPEDLEIARWIAIAVLVVVATGWRPRFTGLLHWWISVSWASSGILIDGGDQVTAVLTTLLLPITLTDGRRWHWSRHPVPTPATHASEIARLVASSTFLVIRLQVAIIYFNAGVAKMFVTEWSNGTAMYYWLSSPLFGAPDWIRPFLDPVVQNPFTVTLFTWSVMLFEVGLAMALVMNRRWWPAFLWTGLVFHLGIGIVHGLVSFGLAMTAALLLYLRPVDQEFSLRSTTAHRAFADRVRGWYAAPLARSRAVAHGSGETPPGLPS